MPSPAALPIPTWLLLVLIMAFGAKRQRVDRRGSEAAQWMLAAGGKGLTGPRVIGGPCRGSLRGRSSRGVRQ
jgi:hypothetical protein